MSYFQSSTGFEGNSWYWWIMFKTLHGFRGPSAPRCISLFNEIWKGELLPSGPYSNDQGNGEGSSLVMASSDSEKKELTSEDPREQQTASESSRVAPGAD